MRYVLCAAILLVAVASSSCSSSSSAQAPTFTTIADNLDVFSLTPLNGSQMIFLGNDGDGNEEPWVTDGSPEGTFQIMDILPGPVGSMQNDVAVGAIVVIDEVAYFVANDGTNGVGLWRSDGTAPGTSLVQLLVPAPNTFAQSTGLTAVGDTVFINGRVSKPGADISSPFYQVVVN